MSNNIEILNEIMKPYFDKKEEIESAPSVLKAEKNESRSNARELQKERIEKRKALEIELENLRVRMMVTVREFNEKKEKEIEDYITKAMDSNRNLSAAYGSFVRKDLEKQYDRRLEEIVKGFKDQEEALIEQIEELKVVSDEEKQEKENLKNLNSGLDYTRVDLRQLVEIKDDIRKKLFAERKRLNQELLELKPQQEIYEQTSLELKQLQQEFKEITDKLSNFKYEYNDQNQVINSDEWRKLYEESNEISKRIQEIIELLSEQMTVIHQLNDISKSLEKVEEYIKLTELTKEETAAVMMSMTPWEKEEYDRRKLNPNYKRGTGKNNEPNSDMVEIEDPVVADFEEIDGKIVVKNRRELLKVIFNDIVEEVKNIKGVRLNPSKENLDEHELYLSGKGDSDKEYRELSVVDLTDETPMTLPNGEYVYESDIVEGLENLYSKNKAKTYIVKATGKEYKVDLGKITKFKDKLKECSAIKLIKSKKISKIDVTRILGRVKSEYLFRKAEIGTLYKKTDMPEGVYINRNELIAKLNTVVTSKGLDWFKNIGNKLKTILDEKYNDEEEVHTIEELEIPEPEKTKTK